MKTCPVCDTPYPNQHNTCPTDGAVLIESHELAPGHIVRGKYRIVRKLGQGGMGIVYLAEHMLLGGQVALKFLAIELSRNPQFVKRFRNEARAAYQFRHPNIIEVTDLDQDEGGNLFIAMEYVAGPNLRTALRETKGPIPAVRALQVARGVAAGLAAAHARGAVHRDIKPENILLALEPSGEVQPKVLDFGIAAMAENITNRSHTQGLLLTPAYASPEQWRGTPADQLDGRTDLYALGGVLYEMLTGRTPFRASNPEGWMFQHLQGVPEPLGHLRPDLLSQYPGLDAVVMRLLAREREQRFASATILLEALEPLSAQTAPPKPAVEPSATHEANSAAPNSQFNEEVLASGSEKGTAAVLKRETGAEVAPQPEARPSESGDLFSSFTRVSRSGIQVWALSAGLIVIILVVGVTRWLLLSKPITATPVLAPRSGEYAEAQSITITDSTPNAIIHFTVDGSRPTKSSPIYTQPLVALPSGVLVHAIAVADGHKPSSDVVGAYIWSGSASATDPPAALNYYVQGKDAYDRKQYAQARTFFAQACNHGELRACNYLGYLYAQGLGGRQSKEKARAIYVNACDRGNLLSCASLGSLYEDSGDNVNARVYFRKACDGGVTQSCDLLRALP